ncbi:hypothetical protein Aperf_G00000082622 [Anoplocephala perfoliata]
MVPVGQVNARLDLVSQCSDDDDGGGGADDDGVDGCSDLTANLDFSCLSLLCLTDLEIGHEADFYVRQLRHNHLVLAAENMSSDRTSRHNAESGRRKLVEKSSECNTVEQENGASLERSGRRKNRALCIERGVDEVGIGRRGPMPEIEKRPPPPQCENDRGDGNSQRCLASECASNVHGENGRIALVATSSAASLMKKKPTCARAEEGGEEERRVDKEDLKRKREGGEKKKKPALGVLRRKIKPTNGELLARARVPEASLTHYVVAPRWNVSSSSATSPAATSSSVDNEMPRKRARDDASANVPVRQCSSSSSSSSNRSNIEKRVKSIARAAAIARRRPRNPNGHLSITSKHMQL